MEMPRNPISILSWEFLKLPPEQEQLTITQKLRQTTFENESTTDDHKMHLIGKARDNGGNLFYVLKNSEGNNKMNGYIL